MHWKSTVSPESAVCTHRLEVDDGALGGSRFSGKGAHMYKGMGVCYSDLSHFPEISHENEII